MERSRVAIVIPAFNEAFSVATVIKSVSKYGIPIVVDDGSEDLTYEVASFSEAIVVRHSKNLGYDKALNSGFKKGYEIGVEIFVTIDADGQHNPELIKEFIDSIDKGADITIGARNRKQRLAEFIFGFYTFILYGIKDPLCGMKAYRLKVYLEQGFFDSLNSVGTQLMIFAVKKKYKVDQIAIHVKTREGKSRFGNLISANLKILSALLRVIFFVR